MYITEVSGHHQATLAIERTLKNINPRLEVLNINGFGYAYPIIEKIVNKAYMGIIKRTPKIWDYLYDNPRIVKKTQSIKEAIHKSNHAKLSRLFDEFQPDTVVCTQAFPCGMVADFKITYKLDTKLIGVLTDYAPHAYWLQEGIDYYVVPSRDAKERFLAEGISEERIKVLGIPVDLKFAEQKDKQTIASRLGLTTAKPILLIMGGGQGLGPIKKIVSSLMKSKTDFQLIVVCGTNKKLLKWLKKTSDKNCRKMIIYEYTNNIDELMEVAALLITKPGGMTTSEALAKTLPMVIINPIPGQEMHNADFLTKEGIAISISEAEEIGRAIEDLLNSPQRLLNMRKAASKNSRPYSSLDIANLILE